jgi:hypothetical protein
MAGELRWHFAEGGSGSAQILSRFPVARSFMAEGIENGRFLGARIRLSEDPLREVVFCTLHLDHTHYGPYAAIAEGATEGKTLAENGLSKRLPQIVAVLAAMQPFLAEADVTPVFLTGDFNVPSHLDWTESIKGKGLGVKWPESVLVAESGLIDSFRLANPDVAKQAGTTWSTIHKESEPQDRIDFMYHKGVKVGVEDSRVFATAVEKTIGPWGSNKKEVEANTWPSDHAAVVTGYQIRWVR